MSITSKSQALKSAVLGILATIAFSIVSMAPAFSETLEERWTLDSEASSLTFQSVKNNSKVETSSFATLTGGIEKDGAAKVEIELESVDTKVDLRNVRMRFLFFETFNFPTATIETQVSAALIESLKEKRRITVPLPYSLDLHGVTKGREAEVVITLITDEMVSITSKNPISVAVADFDLEEGVAKLQDAAKVQIVPTASVSFDFIFRAMKTDTATTLAADATPRPQRTAALEPEGNLDTEACVGRFEILSRTGAIYFKSGSADLDGDSLPLLNTVLDIVQRCPDLNIVVAGHTDSAGDSGYNQGLSERRARSVSTFLTVNGVDQGRMRSVGFGEDKPVAPNDTARNRGRNRRIEFLPDNG